MIQVADVRHSRISPSSWERVSACTMSTVLSAAAPPRLARPAAAAGTAQHAIAEKCMREGIDTYELPLGELRVDGHVVDINAAKMEAVQKCIDWVRENVPGPPLLEHRVDIEFAEPVLGEPMWGFIDVFSWGSLWPPADGSGHPGSVGTVVDYKFGHGEVAANTVQTRIYLLAALQLTVENADIPDDQVFGRTVVLQPASKELAKVHEWTVGDLRGLRANMVMTFERIARGDFTFAAGPHCLFCPAIGLCPHLEAVARDSALTKISPTPEMVASGELSADKLDELLAMAPIFDAKIKALWSVAHDYLLHGGVLKSAKLVHKRKDRVWRDADAEVVAIKLSELGVEDPWNRKIVTPAGAERLLPPAKRKLINATLAEKPEGELTIVASSNNRPAVDVGARLRAVIESSKAYMLLAPHRGDEKR